MTDYKNVKYKVPTLNLDGTSEASPVEGEIWYNNGKFYFGSSETFSSVWSSGGNI